MSPALLRSLKPKLNIKKGNNRYYRAKYNIVNVIKHYPIKVKYAYQVKFLVQWNKGKKTTVESWKRNKSLHNNSVILKYMLSNAQLKQFVPDVWKSYTTVKRKFHLEDSDYNE